MLRTERNSPSVDELAAVMDRDDLLGMIDFVKRAVEVSSPIEHYIVDLTTTGPDGADIVQHIEFFKPAAPATAMPADPSAPPPSATPTALFDNLNFETQSAVTDALNDDFKAGKAISVQP